MRLGAATIELAICLPVIVTIIFGSIESCNLIFLRQAATTAAYEGALVAMKTGADEADVILRTNNILAARKITGATLSIDGNGGGFTTLGHGDQFTITLDVPVPANIPAPRLFSSGNMSVSVVAAKQ